MDGPERTAKPELGARVHSLDVDQESVACTRELKRRCFPDDPEWTVERAPVLDDDHMETLGDFDVVYSWGVLHHTGSMWEALESTTIPVATGGRADCCGAPFTTTRGSRAGCGEG